MTAKSGVRRADQTCHSEERVHEWRRRAERGDPPGRRESTAMLQFIAGDSSALRRLGPQSDC